MSKDLSRIELERVIERQNKIIANYESVSFFYDLLKKTPFLGSLLRFLAGILKSGKPSGTKVINEIKSKNPEIIAVSNPDYRGVTSATKELVSDFILVSEIHSKKMANKIAKEIADYNPQKILISGFAKGHEILIRELKTIHPEVRIFCLIHSAFVWFDYWPAETKVFESFLNLAKEGIIEKIGFCKKDLAEYFKEFGYNTYFVMNRFYPEKHELKQLSKDKIKIGIWGKNFWHRNITNQTIAALMIKRTEIHVNQIGDHSFLNKTRIRVHGFLPKKEFHQIFKEMDLNMYISFTECFPMSVVESMQYGIPCLVSDTSDVYRFNLKLKKMLTVSTVDGPLGIKNKIEETLKNYEEIQKLIKEYLPILKLEVEKSIEEFLK